MQKEPSLEQGHHILEENSSYTEGCLLVDMLRFRLLVRGIWQQQNTTWCLHLGIQLRNLHIYIIFRCIC